MIIKYVCITNIMYVCTFWSSGTHSWMYHVPGTTFFFSLVYSKISLLFKTRKDHRRFQIHLSCRLPSHSNFPLCFRMLLPPLSVALQAPCWMCIFEWQHPFSRRGSTHLASTFHQWLGTRSHIFSAIFQWCLFQSALCMHLIDCFQITSTWLLHQRIQLS